MTCLPFKPLSFTDRFVYLNSLMMSGFARWSFQPGMLFAATIVWWPSQGSKRPQPHEGVDFAAFVDNSGTCQRLSHGALVPVLADGEVVAIFADYLGQSILVNHGYRQEGATLHALYAHCRIAPGVGIGYHCRAGEVISQIAPTAKGPVPAHLHLSTLWLRGRMEGEWSWPGINCATNIRMCDPLPLIGTVADTYPVKP